MAFLGGFQLVGIMTASAEAGAAAGATIGIGEAAGAVGGRFVAGAVAGALDSKLADYLGEQIDAQYGEGTSKKIKENINYVVETTEDALESTLIGDEGYKKRIYDKKLEALRYQKKLEARQREIDASNQFFIESMRPGYDNTQPGQGLYVDRQFDDIKLSPDQEVLMGQFFNQVSKVNPFTNKTEQVEKVKKIANDLGDLLTKDLSQNLGLDPVEGLNSFDITHPLAESVLGYALDVDVKDFIPTDDLYKQISQVYNGRRIVKESVFREPRNDGSGLSIFAAYEEDGNPVVYYEHTDGIKMRPVWPGHVFTGPNSPNNALPVDLFDTFSFYHDCSYQEFGWFDRVGDYKYISRLSQNFDRFPDIQKPMIRNTIRYFSSAGTLLSFFNNRPVNVPTPDQVNQQIEQFNQQQAGKLHFLNYVDSNIDVNEEIIKVFNDTLEEKLITESANIIQTATTNSQTLGNLDYEVLRNLDVELL